MLSGQAALPGFKRSWNGLTLDESFLISSNVHACQRNAQPHECIVIPHSVLVRSRQIPGSVLPVLSPVLFAVKGPFQPCRAVYQSSSDPPDGIGISFALDIIKRYHQLMLIIHETATSFTAACLLDDESIHDGLVPLCLELQSLAAAPSVIRLDPTPGFSSLSNEATLRQYGFVVKVSPAKNLKNAVPNSEMSYSASVLKVVRIHNRELSARQMWLNGDQFS